MILATAGHVDHGKSTLVRMLTGTDPDRWEEEKARGLTIDLGFARLDLPSQEVDIIDVPGHHRFLPNMLAGCGAIDLALFVVSAREGWQAQSEEHLRILVSLGVDVGVVALTHADLVDAERRGEVRRDLARRFGGTFLEHADVVATAETDISTVEGLRTCIQSAARHCVDPVDDGRPRLWIDRSFTLPGVGRVVTGTLTGGGLVSGDALELFTTSRREPGKRVSERVRIRGLHRFGSAADRLGPGRRVGVNIVGFKQEPRRGDALARADQWVSAARLHVQLTGDLDRLRNRPRASYRFFAGSTSVPCSIRLLKNATYPDPRTSFARVLLGDEIGPIAPGDRFVLRDDGRNAYVGGGAILADSDDVGVEPTLEDRAGAVPRPPHRDPELSSRLSKVLVHLAGDVIGAETLRRQTGAVNQSDLVVVDGLAIRREHLRYREDELAARVQTAGATGVDPPGDRIGSIAVGRLKAAGRVEIANGRILSALDDAQSGRLEASAARLVALLDSGGPGLLERRELVRLSGCDDRVIGELLRRGKLVEVPPFVTTARHVDRWRTIVVRALTVHGRRTTGELREALGVSRRLAVPILEWMDDQGITRRIDNVRCLVGARH